MRTLSVLLPLGQRVATLTDGAPASEALEVLESQGMSAAFVTRREGGTQTITLNGLRLALSQPFGRSLYFDRPLSVLIDAWPAHVPEFGEDDLISDAVVAGLARQGGSRQEPIVIRSRSGERVVAAFHLLLVAQSEVLRLALEDAREQREAAETSQRASEALQQELIEASRKAGKAEMAIGVLHNVGNVLNSFAVSLSMMDDVLEKSRAGGLAKCAGLIKENRGDLAGFFSSDRGAKLCDYLGQLSEAIGQEHERMAGEVKRLSTSSEHLQSIVAAQQRHASGALAHESLSISELVGEALRIEGAALLRHRIEVSQEHEAAPAFSSDRHLLLQVLVNLLTNAKRAIDDADPAVRRITIRSRSALGPEGPRIRLSVEDTGVGIEPGVLPKLFTLGFTTKKTGHGFGLHSSATVVQQLGGAIEASSEGPWRGACFTITLPLAPAATTGSTGAPEAVAA